MLDFDIQRCTRKCHASGRELAPGETFYSALVSQGAEVVRRDFSAAAWTGPPEGTIGWWKTQIPEPNAKKMQLAPSDVMLQYFAELEGRPDKEDERYVLALLMIRRRVVRQERVEHDALQREVLVLFSPKNECEYRTPVVMPTPERIQEIQAELGRLLFSEAAT